MYRTAQGSFRIVMSAEILLEFLYRISDICIYRFFSMSGHLMCPLSFLYTPAYLLSLAVVLACKMAKDLPSQVLYMYSGWPAKCQARH